MEIQIVTRINVNRVTRPHGRTAHKNILVRRFIHVVQHHILSVVERGHNLSRSSAQRYTVMVSTHSACSSSITSSVTFSGACTCTDGSPVWAISGNPRASSTEAGWKPLATN